MSVICPHCSREFKGEKLNARHLSKCDPSSKPPVPPCLCGHESTSLTQMKRHRRDCSTWQSRDKKALASARREATSLDRYGIKHATKTPEALAKQAATNKARYGAENVFSREASTFDQVQASLDGRRFRPDVSPFADPEVQARSRATMVERYGVENAQQVPEVRARTSATMQARYGGSLMASPELAEKSRETNEARYGDAFPQRTAAVKERQRQTNLERWGVEWTGQHPDIRARQLATHHERYGSHWFASDEGKEAIRAAMLEKYGVDHPAKMEGFWDKVVATFQERFGVDHPLQLPEFRAKQRATNIERYGNPFPGLCSKGMNGLETKLFDLAPEGALQFTGDGAFWKRLPHLGRFKNPDFIVPGPDPEHPFRGVTKVVEAFGDFWHSRIFTGKAPFAHEQELIDAFADIGIECLVVWESELKADPSEVQERLVAFLSGA